MIFKKILDKETKSHHQLLQTIIDTIEGAVFVKDINGSYQFVNSAFCKDFGVNKNEVVGKNDYSVFPPEVAAQLQETDKRIIKSNTSETVEESGELRGTSTTYRTNKVPLLDENGQVYGICGIGFDITKQKKLEEEREQLITELRKALDEIKTLKGIIPICSYCKKIRDDKGAWDKVETYICAHSEAEFSHGICPECYKSFKKGDFD